MTSAYEIPTRWLSKLTQTSSVKEYQHQFEAMSNKVTDVNPTTLKEMLMSGLKVEIQKGSIKDKLESLVETFALAQLYERDELSTDVVRHFPSHALIPHNKTKESVEKSLQTSHQTANIPP